MKLLILKTSFLLFTLSFLACDKKNQTPKSSEKQITSFNIGSSIGKIDQTSKKISILVPLSSDLKSLTPTITISDNSSISPASGIKQNFTKPVTYTVTAEDASKASYEVTVTPQKCVDESSITTFEHNGKKYEIVKVGKSWVDAAACAVERGGYLAEITTEAEQVAIYNALVKASISASNTVAPDGGGASYVWIGGNDIEKEGSWVWDGDNKGQKTPFWIGKQDGKAVNNSYTNWGKEPDDFGSGQDALGLAITDWPLGVKSQWNDVQKTNKLYFVIEYK